jgi:thiamine pyrophosphokinase
VREQPARRAILVGPLARDRAWLSGALKRLKVSRRDLVIGVDHGAECLARAGHAPDFAIGDWDSLRSEKSLRGILHITLSRDKERSDFFFALEAAVNARVHQVICLGLTGGRPDHHLGVLMDLADLAGAKGKTVRSVAAYAPEGEYHFLDKTRSRWSARLRPGTLVSLFSLGDKVGGLTLKGFKFPLKNDTLRPSSHGLSNVALKSRCEVRLKSGKLVVIVPNHD